MASTDRRLDSKTRYFIFAVVTTTFTVQHVRGLLICMLHEMLLQRPPGPNSSRPSTDLAQGLVCQSACPHLIFSDRPYSILQLQSRVLLRNSSHPLQHTQAPIQGALAPTSAGPMHIFPMHHWFNLRKIASSSSSSRAHVYPASPPSPTTCDEPSPSPDA